MILGLILLDDTQASFNEWLSQNAVYLAFALAGFILLCVLLLLFIPIAKKKKKGKKAVIAKAQTMDALGGEENVLSHLRKGSRIELKLKNYDLLKKDELKEAGIPFNEDKNCYQCQFQEDLAGEAVRKILAASMRPDAIMCANDKMALGAIRALREAGFSVPNEVSVAGGDNIELAAYVTPGLTTFENQAARQGAEACRLLLDMINGNKRPDQLISSQLVMRESV